MVEKDPCAEVALDKTTDDEQDAYLGKERQDSHPHSSSNNTATPKAIPLSGRTLQERWASKRKGKAISVMAGLTALFTLKAGEAQSSEPIPADTRASLACVEDPHDGPDTIAINGWVTNHDSSTIEARHQASPPYEEEKYWARIVSGQNANTPAIYTFETSIPETDIIFYGKRDGESEQVIGEDTVGPKDCTTEDDGNGGTGGPEYTINTEEMAGSTPAETAVLNSRKHFAEGEASRVVVATDQEFADALAGGPLAGAVNGPILYSSPENLYDTTAEELDRLGTHEVLLLGGDDALSADVERQIRNMGINVTRIAGPTRLETAVAIDEYMDQHTNAVSNKAYLVNGWKFADAVAVSGLAAQEGAPIQLTAPDELSETTRRHLESERSEVDTVTAIGGTAVVQSQALRESGDAARAQTNRLSGENRYQTSEAVAKADFDQHGNEAQDAEASMYTAPADTFHGALAAAPSEGGQDNATLMLIPKDNLDLLSSFQRVVEGYKHTSWEDAIVSGDVSDEVLQRVDDILDATSPVNE